MRFVLDDVEIIGKPNLFGRELIDPNKFRSAL